MLACAYLRPRPVNRYKIANSRAPRGRSYSFLYHTSFLAQTQKLYIASGPSSHATTENPESCMVDLIISGVGAHLCSSPTNGEPGSQIPHSGCGRYKNSIPFRFNFDVH